MCKSPLFYLQFESVQFISNFQMNRVKNIDQIENASYSKPNPLFIFSARNKKFKLPIFSIDVFFSVRCCYFLTLEIIRITYKSIKFNLNTILGSSLENIYHRHFEKKILNLCVGF